MRIVKERKPWNDSAPKEIVNNVSFPFILLHPSEIKPRHGVLSLGRLRKLKLNMETEGWQGRPLLGLRYHEDSQVELITGSHRYAAAKDLQIEIPTMVVNVENHGFSPDCPVCGSYQRWETFENPCEELKRPEKTYEDIERVLRLMNEPLAAELFHLDIR